MSSWKCCRVAVIGPYEAVSWYICVNVYPYAGAKKKEEKKKKKMNSP
jgi:hypothetical protein